MNPIELAARYMEIGKDPSVRGGNSRTPAMLMNYQLMAAGFLPVSIAKEERTEYFETLEAIAADGDLPAL